MLKVTDERLRPVDGDEPGHWVAPPWQVPGEFFGHEVERHRRYAASVAARRRSGYALPTKALDPRNPADRRTFARQLRAELAADRHELLRVFRESQAAVVAAVKGVLR